MIGKVEEKGNREKKEETWERMRKIKEKNEEEKKRGKVHIILPLELMAKNRELRVGVHIK